MIRSGSVSFGSSFPRTPGPPGTPNTGHFRAHGRRSVQLGVVLRSEREGAGWERPGRVIDIHLAGAGVETEEALSPQDRITIVFATPTLWDPLVISAIVAWAHPAQPTAELDALGRPRRVARSGLRFDYPTPDAVFAMFEMLQAVGYE
jgi:hypothetical protein